jgi:hypothetical protein
MAKHLPHSRGLFMAAIITAGLTGIAGTASASAAGGPGTAGSPAPVVAGSPGPPAGSPAPAGAARKPAGKPAPPPGAGENPLQNIPEHVKAAGTTAYPDIYGGLAATRHGTHIDVYLTRPDPHAEHQLAAQAPAGTITFVHTPHSLKFLDSLHQKVISQYYALKAAGIQLIEWAPEIQTGREMIGVKDLTPAKAKILDSRFGASNIELQNMPNIGLGLASADRAYDYAPWDAGDFITDYNHGCTSGFGVKINGYPGLITADHCFAYQDKIYNYDNDCPCGSNRYLGYISQNDNRSGGSDTEVLFATNGGSSGRVYVGSPSTQSDDVVSGWADNPAGYTVCNSGAYSGTVCSLQIENNNTCITETETGRYVCHLIHALSTNNSVANETGDSGGPIYRVINGAVYAVGSDVGYATYSNGAPVDGTPCQYYANDEICTSDIYYNAIDYVLSSYNATIITG